MTTDYVELFTSEFIQQIEERKTKTDHDPATWNAGGRASKAWPNKEDSSWWLTEGPRLLELWAQWWEQKKQEGWAIWTAPGNVPAIELQISAILQGTTIKGYIDVVLVDPDGDLVIVDWKSGKMEPIAPIQLGAYAVAMKKTLGVEVRYGACFMVRKGELGHLYDLSIYTEERVGAWLGRAADIERRGNFIPHPSSLCSACGVRPYCAVMGGEFADSVPLF